MKAGCDRGGDIDIFEYLKEEFYLLDLLLERVLKRYGKFTKEPDISRFLCISDGEVLSLVRNNFTDSSDNEVLEEVHRRKEKIRVRFSDDNISLPVYRLCKLLNLTEFEKDILLLGLAPEVNRKYERIYGYINDDMSRRYPTASMAIEVFSGAYPDSIDKHKYFCPNAPVFHFNLIELVEDETSCYMNRGYRLRSHIKDFLLGQLSLSSALVNSTTIYWGDLSNSDLPDEETCTQMEAYLERLQEFSHILFWISGVTEQERVNTALGFCSKYNMPVFVCDLSVLVYEDNFVDALKDLFVLSVLFSGVVVITNIDVLDEPSERASLCRGLLLNYLRRLSFITIATSQEPPGKRWSDRGINLIPVELKRPEYHKKLALWKKHLSSSQFNEEFLGSLACRYNLTESEIVRIASITVENTDNNNKKEVYRSINKVLNRDNLSFIRKLEPRFCWDDIVLPPDRMSQLQEICSFVDHRHRVFYQWGFDDKMPGGKGINILFSGPSGTGKTMAADIITGHLGADIYRIDLSIVVSKYIGETEKNLKKIFDFADKGNVVLFFDEADSLFGRRSEIKDSHDRYANIETNYLLQKIEDHEAIVILATNLSKNIDEAFLRRMHFVVEFPFPEKQYRLQIWQRIFPKDAPVADDVDLEFLAEHLHVSGANIRNIAIASAVYAAAEDQPIGMKHIIKAAAREYQKTGKLCTKTDFGEYFHYVEEIFANG